MSKRDDLIVKYAADLKDKCGVTADMDLLTKVTIGLGPSDAKVLATVKNKFLIKKLGLTDSPDLDKAIDAVIEKYGRSNRTKYRVVVYYLLAKHFKKEGIYS